MSKKKSPRPVAENEALAFAAAIRTSPRKLNLVAAFDDIAAIRRTHLRRL